MTLTFEVQGMRKEALGLIEELKKSNYIARREDLEWWRLDSDRYVDSIVAKTYVESHRSSLELSYPPKATKWFRDFYSYLIYFLLPFRVPGRPQRPSVPPTSYIDWNLFFTLARPIDIPEFTSFKMTIQKLEIAQDRDLREALKEECFRNPELRNRLLKGEPVPPKYTEDLYYKDLVKYVVIKMGKKQRGG
jgi:hypothetical protein